MPYTASATMSAPKKTSKRSTSSKKALSVSTSGNTTNEILASPSFHIQTESVSAMRHHYYTTPQSSTSTMHAPNSLERPNTRQLGSDSNGSAQSRISSLGSAMESNNSLSPDSSRGSLSSTASSGQPKRHNYFIATSDSPQYAVTPMQVVQSVSGSGSSSSKKKGSSSSSSSRSKGRSKSGLRRRQKKKAPGAITPLATTPLATLDGSPHVSRGQRAIVTGHHTGSANVRVGSVSTSNKQRTTPSSETRRRPPSSPQSPTGNAPVRRIMTSTDTVSNPNWTRNSTFTTSTTRSTNNGSTSSPSSPRFVINTATTASGVSLDSQHTSDESETSTSSSQTATSQSNGPAPAKTIPAPEPIPTTTNNDTSSTRARSNSHSATYQRANDDRYNIAYYPGQKHLFAQREEGEDVHDTNQHEEPPLPAQSATPRIFDSSSHYFPSSNTADRYSAESDDVIPHPPPTSPYMHSPSARSHTGSAHLSRPSSSNRYSHSSSRSSASISRSAHYNSMGHHNAHSAHSSFAARGSGVNNLHSSFRSSASASHYSTHFSAQQPTLNLLDSTPLPHMHNSIPVCTIDQSRHLPLLVSRNFLQFAQYDYNTDTWNDLSKPPRKRKKSFMLHQTASSARREAVMSLVCRKETMNQDEHLYIVSSMRKTSILEYDFSTNKWRKFKLNGLTKELKKKGPFFPGHTIVYDESTDQAFLFGGFEKRLQGKDRKSGDSTSNSLFRISFKTRMYEELAVPQKDDFGIALAPVLRTHHSACLWVPSMEAAVEILQQQQRDTPGGGTPSSTASDHHSSSSYHHRSLSSAETPNSMSMRYMVVFGGESLSGIILKDVWLFDLKTLKWTKMETTNPCTISRGSKGHRACCVGDKMLVACTQVMSTSFDAENPEPCTFLSIHQLDLRTKTWSYVDLSISISAQSICGMFCIPFETLKYPYPSCIIVTESGLHILSQGNRRGSTKKSQHKIRTVSLISATSNSSRDSKEDILVGGSSDSNMNPELKRQRSHSTPTWTPPQSDNAFTSTQYQKHSDSTNPATGGSSSPMGGNMNRLVIAPHQESQTASDFSDLTSTGSVEESSHSSSHMPQGIKQPSMRHSTNQLQAARDSLTSLDSHPSSEDKNSGSIFNKVTIEKLNPQLAKFLYNFQQQERRLSMQQSESLDTGFHSRPALKRKSSRFMVNGQDGKTYTVEIIGDQDATPETIPSGSNLSQDETPVSTLGSFGIGFALDTGDVSQAETPQAQTGNPFDLKIQFNIDPNSKTGQGMTFKTESGTFFYHDIRITEHGITQVPRGSMRLSMRKSYRNSTMQALLEREEYNIDFDDLEEIRQLGYGASSKVFLVQHRETGKEYAMKVMGCEEDFQPELIISEIKAFFRCRKSPYIVSFHQAYYIEQEIHMLLEYMDEGSLGDSVASFGKMPETVIGCIAVRVLKGLMHLHEKRIIHRDIKPENILLSKKGAVKIGDFGLIGYKDSRMSIRHSFESETTHFDTPKGTYVYMSPERFEGRKYSYNSDVWSFGMTLVKLRTGQLPFETCGSYWKLVQEMKSIRNLTLDTSVFSKGLRDLIYKCIVFDPHKRPASAELLEDPWIQHFEQMGDEENAKCLAQWIAMQKEK